MKNRCPSYVVAEVPAPTSVAVQAIRDELSTPLAKLPVEITLGGSSGVGAIPAGSDLAVVADRLDALFAGICPIRAAFSGIEAFPGGSILYLALTDRERFDEIHDLLRNAEIGFSESPFPYTPHCSIRTGEPLGDAEMMQILEMEFPTEPFEIRAISLYSLDPETWDCERLHRIELTADKPRFHPG